MSTSSERHGEQEGTLKMERGGFEESIKAIERPIFNAYGNPREVFDRLRKDERFAQRVGHFMHAGGFGIDFDDYLCVKVTNEVPIDKLREHYEVGLQRNGIVRRDFDGFMKLSDHYQVIIGKPFPVILVRFDQELNSTVAIGLMSGRGLRPLTAVELAALELEFPTLSLERSIVGLGSVLETKEGHQLFFELSSSYEQSQCLPCVRLANPTVTGKQKDRKWMRQTTFAATSMFI